MPNLLNVHACATRTYYESGKAEKWQIGLADGSPCAFAGLWERWERDGEALESCTIVVTQANERIAEIHDRMPVILDPADFDAWLDPALQDATRFSPLLRPYPAERTTLWPVGLAVNRPGNEGPELMAPV